MACTCGGQATASTVRLYDALPDPSTGYIPAPCADCTAVILAALATAPPQKVGIIFPSGG